MDVKQQSGLPGFMQKNPTLQVDRKQELGKDQFLKLLDKRIEPTGGSRNMTKSNVIFYGDKPTLEANWGK